MIVKDRKGDWVARIYTQNPGEDFKVICEQYYATRAEMRDGIQLWKKLTASSTTKVKIKSYRIKILGESIVTPMGVFNTVVYKEAR